MSDRTATVIGAGLAGCEAAWQLAQKGIQVRLIEMKPVRMLLPQHGDVIVFAFNDSGGQAGFSFPRMMVQVYLLIFAGGSAPFSLCSIRSADDQFLPVLFPLIDDERRSR